MSDKDIRAAKLTAAGILDKRRAATAVDRAGGQIAPSQYLPGVPRQVHATGGRAENFTNWFKGSKVRDFSSKVSSRDTRADEEFPPLAVYHGTRHDFEEFRPHGTGTTTFMGIPVQHERHGIFFSESPEFSEGFANPPGERKTGKVMKFHLNIRNPLVADAEGYVDPRDKERLKAVGMDHGFVENYLGAPTGNGAMWENFDGPDGKFFTDKLKEAGYDGVNFHEEDPDTGKLHSTWVAFHPAQVKSPDLNSGDFDPNDNRFTKAKGGAAMGKDSAAENIADYIADLLRQGRGREVTDDLMAQADHQRLHHHYSTGNTGQPMAMDYASRMARAGQMGFDTKTYHGTGRDFPAFDLDAPHATDEGWFGKAVYSSPDPRMASWYGEAHGHEGGANVMPLRAAMNEPWVTTHQKHTQEYVDRLRRDTGADTLVRTDNESWPMERAAEIASYDPRNLRSDFARFDPRLAHLSNLNAATGGRIGRAPGGYVPQASISAPRLAVAQAPSMAQSSTMDTLGALADLWKSQQPAQEPQQQAPSPSAATEGHAPATGVSAPAQAALDALRGGWTGQPFSVVSDYRDPTQNQAVGGAKGSQHLSGNAFDIDTSGWTPEQKLALATQAYNSGFRGFGFYDNNLHFDVGGQRAWGPSYHQESIPDWAQDWTQQYIYRQGRATGGRLYSRAAQIIRGLPQGKFDVDQALKMLASKGVKPSELTNAGRPTGKAVSKEELASHFERAVPGVQVTTLNSGGLSEAETQELADILHRYGNGGISAEEMSRYRDLNAKNNGEAKYYDYTLPGGENYREHLLHLPDRSDAIVAKKKELQDKFQQAWQNDNQAEMKRLAEEFDALADATGVDTNFKSSHWDTPNVLAHVRMQDRDNGKTLHVEEVQSDWGQGGRKQGFYDPQKPIEVFHTGTGKTVHATNDMGEAKAKAEELGPQYDYGYQDKDKVPGGPYVSNTQAWTDLALKHVLGEAAKGGYDRVVFSPGEANADLYNQRSHINRLQLIRHDDSPYFGSLHAWGPNGEKTMSSPVDSREDLDRLVGKGLAEKLLAQPREDDSWSKGRYAHTLEGLNTTVGGEGMTGFYRDYVHKGAQRLAQQHDPSIKAEPYDLPGGYTGLSIPITDTLRQSVLNNGFPAFKDGGTVGEEDNAQASAGDRQAGSAAQGLPVAGGVRGGQGLLSAPAQASGEKDLIGLPTSVKLPKLGQSITAGHNPRIRQVAREYAQSAGIDYNPPTTYQKVDPARAKRIADAYEAMPHAPSDPLVKASYDALLRETLAQYQAMKKAGMQLEFYPDPANDPYKSNPRLATEDVNQNNHMFIYPTDAGYGSGEALPGADENPLLRDSGERWNGKSVLFNDLFRAVHDYFGHAKEGVGFRADGEENAWRSHAAMYSPLARIALGSETRGQNSWLNYGPHGSKNRTAPTEDTVFADQKLGVLPAWVHHEGAEDFIRPEERANMAAIYARHGRADGGAVDQSDWTKSEFTPEGFSKALKSSPSASTLTQYDPGEVRGLSRSGKFEGYKLAGHDAYFGIKNGADYAGDYGFEHPALTGKEKALIGVVNNDKAARGVGDSLMKAAINHGVNVLDAFAVPSDKHPKGFLTDFYGKYGFRELGRVAFDPKYVTPEQFEQMKKVWSSAGWDEKRHPLPDVVIMKRAAGGFVSGQHRLNDRFHNGGAAMLMKRHVAKADPVSAALDLTRRFTRDGSGGILALKSKGK